MAARKPSRAENEQKAPTPKGKAAAKKTPPAAKKAKATPPTPPKKPGASPWRAVGNVPPVSDLLPPKGQVGRPNSFQDAYIAQARKLAALGATDIEIADFFGVSVATLFNWRAAVPEFLEATRLGKDAADDRVEQRLYARAMGYEHDEVDIRVVNGEVVQTPIRKFYPPDTQAASLWLRNRRPGAWRDKVEAVHSGPDGGPIQARIAVEFVRPAPPAEDEAG